MGAILTSLGLKGIGIIIGAAALVGGVLWLIHSLEAAGAYRAGLDQATAVNRDNAAAFARVQASNARAISALEQNTTAQAARTARAASILEDVARAPNSNACVASAPVRSALDGLRQLSGGPYANGSVAPASAAKPVAVPAGAPGARR